MSVFGPRRGDRILCLCCGTFYEVDGDCPNVDKVEHSSGLAYVVALRLQRRGLELPTPEQVREALPD